MDEKDMLQWLKEEAEEIEVPEELHPRNIKKKLEEQSRKKKSRIRKQLTAAAALVICSGVIFTVGNIVREDEDVTDFPAITNTGNDTSQVPPEAAADDPEAFGDMYTVAGDYGEVYDILAKNYQSQDEVSLGSMIREFFNGSDKQMESAVPESAADSAVAGGDMGAGAGDMDYSTTNLQTEGVDESDIIKTDGKYIYVVEYGEVVITDIQNDVLEEVGVIVPPLDSMDTIYEMFVDGDRLYLIAQGAETSMTEKDGGETDPADAAYDMAYYMDTNVRTVLYTYDISDRAKPELRGQMKQDGSYQTSRKIDDIIYLFTEYYLELPDKTRKEAIKEENTSSWLPEAGGKVVSCGNIYLPEQGNMGKLITSVDVNRPNEALDTKLMVTNSGEVYVSNEAIYIYRVNWEGAASTEIAKFSMENGKIRGVGAGSVRGEILDTFAINEHNQYLRVLTTDWSGDERENCVTVLDEKLQVCGRITGIAPGEQIYSARFFGDTGYFVTYRNTDPLFTVDFSDPRNPQIKGELKVTGFSEYLHFWGGNKLLGIGYETDPDTGSRIGMKLSMFDISDPCNVTEESRYVLENVDYSPALYDYKCVLADKDKNLIGFVAQKSDFNISLGYLVFKYQDGFENVFAKTIEDDYGTGQNYRGLYVGSRFYLVGSGEITAYDMDHNFEKIAK